MDGTHLSRGSGWDTKCFFHDGGMPTGPPPGLSSQSSSLDTTAQRHLASPPVPSPSPSQQQQQQQPPNHAIFGGLPPRPLLLQHDSMMASMIWVDQPHTPPTQSQPLSQPPLPQQQTRPDTIMQPHHQPPSPLHVLQQQQSSQQQQSQQLHSGIRSIKRPRPVKSCTECRKRKLKCDRMCPCAQCTRTHRECKYATDQDLANLSDDSDTDARVQAVGTPAGAPIMTPVILPSASGVQEAVHRPAKRACLPAMSAQPGGLRLPDVPDGLVSASLGSDAEATPGLLENLHMRLERLEKHVLSKSSPDTDWSSSRTRFLSAAPETIRGLSVKQGAHRTRFYGQASARVMINLFHEAQGYLSENSNVEGLRQTLLDLHKLHKLIQEEHCKSLRPMTVFIDSMIPVQKRMADILPKKDVCDRLLDCYLYTSETLYRMVHVPTFQQQYELYWKGKLESDFFLPQLLCVLSTGARFETKSKGMLHERLDGVHIPTACALVRTWLDSLRGKQRVEFETLQSELLLLYAQRMTLPRPHDSWTHVGAIIRMAMTMGMHRDPSEFEHITPYWAEMRRRVWFTLLDLDTNLSMGLSLPSIIRQGDFTCRPPRNLDDADITPDMNELPPGKPIEQYTDNQLQVYGAMTLSLRMRVAHSINRIENVVDYQEILDLGEKIDRFLDDINSVFPRHGLSNERKSSQWRTRVTADYHLRRPLLCLYRPFAIGVPDAPSQLKRMYLRSSMMILHYLDELDPLMPFYDDVAGMYHFIFKPDLIQASFGVCWYMRSDARSPPQQQAGGGLSPSSVEDAASSVMSNPLLPEALSIWSPARLASTVEKTLALLIRNVGGSDLKDIVLLAVVLFVVQGQSSAYAGEQGVVEVEMARALRAVLDSCMRATNTSAEKLASVVLQETHSGFDMVPGGADAWARANQQQPFFPDGSGLPGSFGSGSTLADIDMWAAWGGWMTEGT